MLPHTVLYLLPVVLNLQQRNVSAFSPTTGRKIRYSSNIKRRNGFDDVWWAVGGHDDDLDLSCAGHESSHIVSIKSTNIAGMISEKEDADIQVDFGNEAGLIAITGESGTGKSLLVSKAIDLVTGGKAVSSFVVSSSTGQSCDEERLSSVELTANLYEPQLSAVKSSLQQYGIDPSILYINGDQSKEGGNLHLKRTLTTINSGRLKSVCSINDKHVSLKTLRQITAPLLVRVDVGVASAALGNAASRLAILDMGVSEQLIQNCIKFRNNYKEAKKNRERIKHDLESRILPSSLQGNSNNIGFDEEQIQLMEHWVEELDSFEIRINRFQEALLTQYNELLSDELNTESGSSGILKILNNLKKASWGGTESDDESLFTGLIDFREEIKAVESQLVSTHAAYESLASLSAPNSAAVALENTRKLLFSISNDDSGPLFETIEKTHELLNDVESALNDCARSIDGNSDSLMSTLEKMAFTGIPIEEVDCIIADWNALARKHGISPYSLPNCHTSIREELDGNVEALKLLPEAEEHERYALQDYSHACRELSDARTEVASKLSQSVSDILPSLGLDGSTLKVELSFRPGGFDEPYYGSETVGVDIAEFLLLHQKNANGDNEDIRGGNIEQVGSSGEKSRVLLAIETALPGSIGSTCRAERVPNQSNFRTPPISIIYDEIDAHVGGRAAVTMAKLLADQSRSRQSSDGESPPKDGSQIIAITHSASLAALADTHIVVERGTSSDSNNSLPIRAYALDPSNRRKEIARMASGDLASNEAQTFADALIRDALLHRQVSS